MKTVILCGGSGTRLWPLSTNEKPKQYLNLFDNQSLFTKTVLRNKQDSLLVISNKSHQKIVEDLSPNETSFIFEEIGRNTAAAILFAALNSRPEDILLILPSDHLINNIENYNACIDKAKEFALDDKLVTFGIKAQHPETGYGYIESNGNDVISFKEKPDFETAKSYLKAGNFYWNSGMFCFKAETFIREIKLFAPDIYEECLKVYNKSENTDQKITLKKSDLLNIRSESIDYAVMEKSKNVKVVPADIEWSDLGSYDSLYDQFNKDQNGNAVLSEFISLDTKNCLIINDEKEKMITTFDIEDLIIINTEDAILIGKRGQSQRVKEIYNKIK